MATAKSDPSPSARKSRPESYRIYDYTKVDSFSERPDYKSWVEDINKLTPDMVVYESKIYKCSLLSLKSWGKPLTQLPAVKNKKLFHTFYVLKLLNEKDAKNKCEISLEKDKKGIFLQFAMEEGVVVQRRKRNVRKNVCNFDTRDRGHFLGSLVDNMVKLKELLEYYDDLSKVYEHFSSNCQHFTEEFNRRIVSRSKEIKLRLAGSPDGYALDDPRIVSCIEDFFPGWRDEKVQLIPEIQDLFPVDVLLEKSPQFEKEFTSSVDYDPEFLVKQQKVAAAFVGALKREEWKEGRKAIFSNMSKVDYEKALLLLGNLSNSEIEIISSYWTWLLEMVVVAEKVGVIVVSFFKEDSKSDTPSYLQFEPVVQKTELISQLGNFDDDTKCLHSINVVFGDRTMAEPRSNKEKKGVHLTILVDPLSEDLENVFHKCMEKIRENTEKRGRSFTKKDRQKEQLRCLTAMLVFLRNLESEDILIHRKMMKQEFGAPNVCTWTSKQMEVVKEARNSFSKGESPLVSVTGCSGSGKTMVLLKVAKDFLTIHPDGKVFVRILHDLLQLKSEVQESFTKEKKMDERIYIGHDPPENMDDFKLILFDEFQINEDGSIHDQEREIFDKVTDQSIFFFSSDKLVRNNIAKAMTLEGSKKAVKHFELGGSLRASRAIAKLNADFHNCNDLMAKSRIEISSAISWEKSPPVIETIEDDSNDRKAWIAEALEMMRRINKLEIFVFCRSHYFLQEKLQRALEECKVYDENLCRKNIIFRDYTEVLGCEFPCLLVLIDVATYFSVYHDVSFALTRATTSLHVLVNRSLVPISINDRPCVAEKRVHRETLEKEVDDLIDKSTAENKTLAIYDVWGTLPSAFKNDRAQHFYTYFGQDDRSRRLEFSRGKNLVVEIERDGYGPTCSDISVASYVLYWALTEKSLKAMSVDFFLDIRKNTIKFFKEKQTSYV